MYSSLASQDEAQGSSVIWKGSLASQDGASESQVTPASESQVLLLIFQKLSSVRKISLMWIY